MTRSFFRLIALAALTGSVACAPAMAAMVDRGSPQAQPAGAGSLRLAQKDSTTAQPPANASKTEDGGTGGCGAPRPYEKQAVDPETLRATAAFTLDVLARLSPQSKNATVSPVGLSSVLSTLYLGASEPMHKAITATLHVGPGKLDELRRAARLLELASARDPHRFASYNAIFVDHRLPLKPGIADLAKADGEIDLQSVDFSSQADIDGINSLLAKKTDGRIKSILDPGSTASLVAANAFAFKDCWKVPFDPAKTAGKPFTLADGSKADRPTMSVTSDAILYGTSGRFVAVELPYLDEEFALTLVTTQHDPAAVAAFKEAAPLLSGSDLSQANVSLSLPKFGGAADNELLDVLSNMGLKPGLASADQLPGFSQGLKLGRVRQKTWLAVDEKGTEAAAVTAAVATRSAEGPKNVTVNFDKPFVFALRHRPTGAILMAGYVADPDASGQRAQVEQPGDTKEKPALLAGQDKAAASPSPWVVSVQWNGFPSCSGTLVRDQWVLTAAYCVVRKGHSQAELSVIRGGPDSKRDGQRRSVVRVVVSAGAGGPSELSNGAALLKLDKPVGAAPDQLAHLMAEGDESVQEAVEMGRTIGGGDDRTVRFRQLPVKIVARSECANKVGSSADKLLSDAICGVYSSKVDQCNGFGGGPLAVRAVGGSWQQLGLISWTKNCEINVYAPVKAFSAWIDKTVAEDEGHK